MLYTSVSNIVLNSTILKYPSAFTGKSAWLPASGHRMKPKHELDV